MSSAFTAKGKAGEQSCDEKSLEQKAKNILTFFADMIDLITGTYGGALVTYGARQKGSEEVIGSRPPSRAPPLKIATTSQVANTATVLSIRRRLHCFRSCSARESF